MGALSSSGPLGDAPLRFKGLTGPLGLFGLVHRCHQGVGVGRVLMSGTNNPTSLRGEKKLIEVSRLRKIEVRLFQVGEGICSLRLFRITDQFISVRVQNSWRLQPVAVLYPCRRTARRPPNVLALLIILQPPTTFFMLL